MQIMRATSLKMDYFSKDRFKMSGFYQAFETCFSQHTWQKPVDMRGATVAFVTVRPGDFILGDEDGVIAIPQALAEPVLVEAEKLTQQEIQIRAELKNGLTLAQALEKFGAV